MKKLTLILHSCHEMNINPCYTDIAEGNIPELIFMVIKRLPQRLIIKSPIIPISWQMSFLKRRLVCFSLTNFTICDIISSESR